MIIEGFEYIKFTNSIEGVELNQLEDIIKNGECDNYSLKTILYVQDSIKNNGLIIYDKEKKERFLIKCVCNYYNLPCEKNCNDIKNFLNSYDSVLINCKDCHLKAINKYNKNEIIKINISNQGGKNE